GGLLEPYGDQKPEEAEEGRLGQECATPYGDRGGTIIETMTDLEEMKLALKAARQATSLPVIVSMSFQNGSVPHRTLMGQKTTDCALALKDAGASVIGSNCGVGSAELLEIVREMHSVLGDVPLIAEPNAGLPIIEGDKTVFPETPEEMASRTGDFVRAGVRLLGGCCGTSPKHIRALRQALDQIS
ncbi:MAG TPA: homocysteine S-methyltransferase family protein, partial [bacterium]|nr:homocysteine S-methyltransferase family protein [bacterium]